MQILNIIVEITAAVILCSMAVLFVMVVVAVGLALFSNEE